NELIERRSVALSDGRQRRKARVDRESRVGRAVGDGQLMIALGFVNRLQCRPEIRALVERDLPQIVERASELHEVERSSDVELVDGRPIVQEHQQLNLRGPDVHLSGLQVGLVLDTLKLQSVQVDLRDVPHLKAVSTYGENLVKKRHVVSGEREDGFGLQY